MTRECNNCGVPLAGLDSVDGVCSNCYKRTERTERKPTPAPIPTTPRLLTLMTHYGNASSIAASVVDQVLLRDSHGQQKYGISLDRGDLSIQDWLQHMTEELLDGAHYALCIKREFRRELMELATVAATGLEGVNVDQTLTPTEAFSAGVKAMLDHIGVDEAQQVLRRRVLAARHRDIVMNAMNFAQDQAQTLMTGEHYEAFARGLRCFWNKLNETPV